MSVTIHTRPPTFDGHKFLVRVPFGVFLDYMERSWSLESDHMLLNEIGAHILVEKLIITTSVLIVGCVDVRSYVLKWPLHGRL